MITINNATGVMGSSVMPVIDKSAPAPTPAPAAVKVEKSKPEASDKQNNAATEVDISPKAMALQATGLTSVQFDTDPKSGKSMITVISKDDNTIIRQISSPITVSKNMADQIPAYPTLNTTA
jgi:uncharacterized FlaG/YvyC family protein